MRAMAAGRVATAARSTGSTVCRARVSASGGAGAVGVGLCCTSVPSGRVVAGVAWLRRCAGPGRLWWGCSGPACARGPGWGGRLGGLVAGAGDFHVLQHAEGVGDEDRAGVVGADQVGDDRFLVDAHEADVQARFVLVGDAGLVQADDALVVLAGAQDQDRGGVAAVDRDLGAGEDRHAAPGDHGVALDVDGVGVQAAAAAFAAEGGDRAGVGEEELRAAAAREQFVQVVGGGGACVGGDALVVVGVVPQPELGDVDQFVFLAFAQFLDGQAQLLLDLVHRLVVEVGDAAVHAQHGLGDGQVVFAGGQFVVDEGAGQFDFALVSGGQFDGGLAVAVLGLAGGAAVPVELVAQRGVAQGQGGGVGGREGQDGGGGGGFDGVFPDAVGLGEGAVAEVVAVGGDCDDGLVAVFAFGQAVDLAVGDQDQAVDGGAEFGEHGAGGHVLLDEPVGDLGEQGGVVQAGEGRQFGEAGRDDAHLVAGLGEADPSPSGEVGQAAVDAVGAAGHLHPGQHAQQPPGGDALHLRGGLGGGGQVARGGGAQRLLAPVAVAVSPGGGARRRFD